MRIHRLINQQNQIIARLILSSVLAMTISCDQDPAFVDRAEVENHSADAIAEASRTSKDDVQTAQSDDLTSSDWTESDWKNAGDDASATDIGGSSTKPTETTELPALQLFEVEQVFSTGSLVARETNLDLPSSRVESVVRMDYERTPKNFSITQPTRTAVRDNFVQGSAGQMMRETTKQIANKALDLLVVIDNSRSMVEEQQNLATKLSPLLQSVKESDWQIAVTTTDPDDGCVRDIIRKSDNNAASKFAKAIQAGTNGSGNERGILQAFRALQPGCIKSNWPRANSQVSVLIVSDEDNCSDGSDCVGEKYASESYLLDYLGSIRQLGVNSRVYGIIWHPDEECSTALSQAKTYNAAITKTGGTYGSICDADYTPTLAKISEDIAVNLASQIQLQNEPDPGSLEIRINGQLTTDYQLVAKSVVFQQPPPDGASIEVNYTKGQTPRFANVQLSKTPYQAIIDVTINGSRLSANSFRLDPVSRQLDFQTQPADNARISIDYLEDVKLIQELNLNGKIDSASIQLSINQQSSQEFDYDAANNRLRLTSAQQAGSRIQVRYVEIGGAQTRFALSSGTMSPDALQVVDDVTRNPVPHVFLNGSVQVPMSEFAEGRNLRISYRNPLRQKFAVTLAGRPLESSFKITWENGSCDTSGIRLENTILNFEKCSIPTEITEVQLRYDDWKDYANEFVFDAADREIATPVRWRVSINDQPTEKYRKLEGRRFVVDEQLAPGDIVRIAATLEKIRTDDE